MSNTSPTPYIPSFRLAWLIKLRWIALFSLLSCFALTKLVLQFSLDSTALLIAVAIIIASNLALPRITNFFSSSNYQTVIVSCLFLDTFLLAFLLYSYGGYTNPFSMTFLALVPISACLLSARWTWIFLALGIILYSSLFFWYQEIPEFSHSHHQEISSSQVHLTNKDKSHAHHHKQTISQGFDLHLQGMLLGFIILGSILAYFLTRMQNALLLQEKLLSEEKQRRLRDEQLIGIASLAAGAAHELATPLNTISLVIEDLSQESNISALEIEEALPTLQEQVRRCSNVLNQLKLQSPEISGDAISKILLSDLIEQARDTLTSDYKDRLHIHITEDAHIHSFTTLIQQALASLINNAFQASSKEQIVTIEASCSRNFLLIKICDQGSGIREEELSQIGRPFYTTKPQNQGLGLGIFLVRVLCSRLGGDLHFEPNQPKGTVAVFTLPLVHQNSITFKNAY